MSPLEIYQQHLASGKFKEDPQQFHAIQELQRIYLKLSCQRKLAPRLIKLLCSWTESLGASFRWHDQGTGLYMWGSVGIGKTWLMDIFLQSIADHKKLRMHFHAFMSHIHDELKKCQGEKDPLKKIAKQIAREADVLCFDEFFVSDITDAMILGNLLNALFNEGVILITTSNVEPDDLYKQGLQRELFLPAIALIKKHTVAMHMQSRKDYRQQLLKHEGFYFYPLNQKTMDEMTEFFEYLAGNWTEGELLEINERHIATVRMAKNIVWFSFKDLCNVPRSQNDYLMIAKKFRTVFLSAMPKIKKEQDNLIQYLINLVDILYDAQVRLVISAEVALDEIYTEGRLLFEFQRTKSRLQEMQSLEYWESNQYGLKR
jgi:cell division protein ZapE